MHCPECYEEITATDRFCPSCGTPLATLSTPRVPIPAKIRFQVLQRDNFQCRYCGRGTPQVVLHVDHVVPVSRGGQNELTNLATACADCNLGKGAEVVSGTSDRVQELIEAEWDRISELINQEQAVVDDRQLDEYLETQDRHMRESQRLHEKQMIEIDRSSHPESLYTRHEVETRKLEWRHEDEDRELEKRHLKEKKQLAETHIEQCHALSYKLPVRNDPWMASNIEGRIFRCRDWGGDPNAIPELIDFWKSKVADSGSPQSLPGPSSDMLLLYELRLAERENDIQSYPSLIARIEEEQGRPDISEPMFNMLRDYRDKFSRALPPRSTATFESVPGTPATHAPLDPQPEESAPKARRGIFRRR